MAKTEPIPPLEKTLRASADHLRLNVLRLLGRESYGVQELARILEIPQPGMSHHLKILHKGGLVSTRRQGNSIFYRRSLPQDHSDRSRLVSQLFATIDSSVDDEPFRRRVLEVHRARSRQSRVFFRKNVATFEQSQGMLCEAGQYMSGIIDLLDLIEVPKNGRAMEIGPGHGTLLKELEKRFSHVTAIDSSEKMLAMARDHVKGNGIEYIHCSLEDLPDPTRGFDAVVMNMVMHHMPSPPHAFAKLSRLLTKRGRLLIAELCSHDQEWVKPNCGDIWLGFDPLELTNWAREANLIEEQSSYLGLKNGFQIQLKLFSKNSSP